MRYKSQAYWKLTPLLYESKDSVDNRISKLKDMYIGEEIDLDEYENCVDEVLNPDRNRIERIFNVVA
jgi:hypothetical protein